MKGLQNVRSTLGRYDPGFTGPLQRGIKSAGLPDPIGEGAAAEIAAERSQKEQLRLLEKQRQEEQLRLAEEESEVGKRLMASQARRAGRASLIRTSATGLLS